jgi:hypothetical protein
MQCLLVASNSCRPTRSRRNHRAIFGQLRKLSGSDARSLADYTRAAMSQIGNLFERLKEWR